MSVSRATPGRLGAGLLLTLLAVGSFALWIGVPAGGMWLASKLTDSQGAHMRIALVIVVPGMIVMLGLLAWLNQLYMRVTGGEIESVAGLRFRRRGPLEPLLVAAFVTALVALFVWFFLFAENPSPRMFG